jgi:hypothetical protein
MTRRWPGLVVWTEVTTSRVQAMNSSAVGLKVRPFKVTIPKPRDGGNVHRQCPEPLGTTSRSTDLGTSALRLGIGEVNSVARGRSTESANSHRDEC